MLVEVRVQSLGLDPSRNPVVILKEVDGERILPIWIGPGEASAIAMQLADMDFPRPLTHDLIVSVLGGLGGELHRVVIDRVEDSTYYAELLVRRNGETITVDARPSDSIAVALRVDARIFAQERLLDQTGIQITEAEGGTHFPEGFSPAGEEGSEGEERLKAEELEEYLRKLNPEDFGRFSP